MKSNNTNSFSAQKISLWQKNNDDDDDVEADQLEQYFFKLNYSLV